MPQIHFSFELLIFLNFAPETFLGEVRIRSVRILIGLGLTWFTRYWFPEELISPLAKPFLTLPFDSYFVWILIINTNATSRLPVELEMTQSKEYKAYLV